MLVNKSLETLLKIILYVEISQKLLAKQLFMIRMDILMSCVSNNQYGYIYMKAIYGGEPKDRNVEMGWMIYKHTERVDSIRKDMVELK